MQYQPPTHADVPRAPPSTTTTSLTLFVALLASGFALQPSLAAIVAVATLAVGTAVPVVRGRRRPQRASLTLRQRSMAAGRQRVQQ